MDFKKNIKAQFHNIQNVPYQEVWDFQTSLHESVKKSKKFLTSSKNKLSLLNHIVFCEHLPVFTLGKSAKDFNFQQSKEDLTAKGFEIFSINRGGDITYHGPGQITGYVILDLELLYRDVHKYVRNLEQAVINVLAQYDIVGQRLDDFTGVWIKDSKKEAYRKICAIGVHLSRWVSMHGIGFNINPDLSHFNNIIPCGIDDANKSVTSLAQELGKELSLRVVQEQLLKELCHIFEIEIVNPS